MTPPATKHAAMDWMSVRTLITGQAEEFSGIKSAEDAAALQQRVRAMRSELDLEPCARRACIGTLQSGRRREFWDENEHLIDRDSVRL